MWQPGGCEEDGMCEGEREGEEKGFRGFCEGPDRMHLDGGHCIGRYWLRGDSSGSRIWTLCNIALEGQNGAETTHFKELTNTCSQH
nr:uncharacterized protein LOC112281010 isoform X11 [Physcomitrium patens]|eukprot:XP_024372883.1 uncharacterized protein LOC112281010 isoform X11 [Physcomitrella patens]